MGKKSNEKNCEPCKRFFRFSIFFGHFDVFFFEESRARGEGDMRREEGGERRQEEVKVEKATDERKTRKRTGYKKERERESVCVCVVDVSEGVRE